MVSISAAGFPKNRRLPALQSPPGMFASSSLAPLTAIGTQLAGISARGAAIPVRVRQCTDTALFKNSTPGVVMLTYQNQSFKPVSADEWADYCSTFPCYGTERAMPESDTPALVHIATNRPAKSWEITAPTGTVLGIVIYKNNIPQHFIRA